MSKRGAAADDGEVGRSTRASYARDHPVAEPQHRPLTLLSERDCQICFDEIEVIDGVGAGRTSCGHLFHGACCGRWFAEHSECPNCREPVRGRRKL